MSRFNKFCKVFFIVFAIIVFIVWALLWIFISDYEQSVSINIVEQIVEQYQNADGKALIDHLDIKMNNYEDSQQFSDYIENIIGEGKVKYVMITSGSFDNPEYILSVDDKVIEKLILTPTGKTFLKNKKWEILSKETDFKPSYSVTINAPSNTEVKINGIALCDKAEQENIVLGLYDNTPTECYQPLFNTYSIDGFYCEPKITAVGANGEDCIINVDDYTGTIYITTPATDEQYQIVTKLTESFSSNYYKYISGAGGFEVLEPFIYENSEFYDYIKSQNVKQLTGNDSSRLESIKIDNCQSYDDTQMSCDVSFNFVYMVNGEEYEYPSAYEINYIKSDNKYKVVNLVAK